MSGFRASASLAVLVLFGAACAGEGDVSAGDESTRTVVATTATPTTTTTPTTTPTPTTTTPQATTTTSVDRVSLTWATPTVLPESVGVEVQATTGNEWPMLVALPDESARAGKLPVVVYFHGSAAGTPVDGLDAIARQGAVVVVPRWILPNWRFTNLGALSPEEYADGYWFDVAACAFAAAQEVAVEYGGDANATTVAGFSAGVHPAAWVALAPPRNNLCPEREYVRPQALVLGDSQLLFQGTGWDATFEEPGSLAVDTVERFLNPDRWVGVPEGFTAYLWSTEATADARDVEETDLWLRTRMQDSEMLISDLVSVGAFEDGRILFDDNALLLEKRLGEAGVPVLHERFSTNHSYTSDVYDRILQLVNGLPLVEASP